MEAPAAAVLAVAILGLLGCMLGGAPCRAAEPDPDPFAYELQWQDSDWDLQKARSAEVYHARVSLIESPLFEQLSGELRHERLLSTGWLGVEQHDYAFAHGLLVRSSAMDRPGSDDWSGRMYAALGMADLDDATLALTRLAQGWPDELSRVPADAVWRIAPREGDSEEQRAASFELRLALYRAEYKGAHEVSPGALWGRLAMELFERGRIAEARDLLPSLNSPRTLLTMRIDRRYDALVREAPALFDVKAAAAREISDYEEAVQRYPRNVDAVAQLCYAYLDAGSYRDVLRAAAAVLSRADDPNSFAAAYDEDETAFNWVLDTYARASAAMRNWDEAVRALEVAAQGLEHGRLNVSNVINLGGFYADLGKPDKALRVLAEISDEDSETLMSPYGRMAWHAARLHATLAKGDAAAADAELAYLRTHQNDAVGAYQDGLLRAGRMEDAAVVLIARLRDPQRYQAALREIQIYQYPPAPPGVVQLRALQRALARRADVQQAVAQVGRIERVPLPPDAE